MLRRCLTLGNADSFLLGQNLAAYLFVGDRNLSLPSNFARNMGWFGKK